MPCIPPGLPPIAPYRVTLDAEGCPMIEGRYGQLEQHDGASPGRLLPSDAPAKGRLAGRAVACGERQHLARLTAEGIVQIRARSAAGESGTDLARDFAVSLPCIMNVIHRRTWRHVA